MKKILIALLLVEGLILFGIQGCKEKNDEIIISLETKTERVSNVWKVDNYKINGVDFTSIVSAYSETFTKDGNYSYQFGIVGGTGKWEFQNNNNEIRITGVDNQASRTLFVSKLESSEFWYYYMEGTDKKEFHMLPK